MPYIKRIQRPLLKELLRAIRQYPEWRSPEENLYIREMINLWLKVLTKDNQAKLDGILNFIFTTMIKWTQRTYCLRKGKRIYNSFDKHTAKFIREMILEHFERHRQGYDLYERVIGLLICMEYEFERRGWSLGRPDIKKWFKNEIKYWKHRLADYEDEKIKQNGDLNE